MECDWNKVISKENCTLEVGAVQESSNDVFALLPDGSAEISNDKCPILTNIQCIHKQELDIEEQIGLLEEIKNERSQMRKEYGEAHLEPIKNEDPLAVELLEKGQNLKTKKPKVASTDFMELNIKLVSSSALTDDESKRLEEMFATDLELDSTTQLDENAYQVLTDAKSRIAEIDQALDGYREAPRATAHLLHHKYWDSDLNEMLAQVNHKLDELQKRDDHHALVIKDQI